jgi:hypothetical protein
MNSRRLIAAYLLSRRLGRVPTRTGGPEGVRSEAGFRFGSEADICNAKRHVRFTPDSDRESGHVPLVMSALSPKADVCGATAHVCFGPKADIQGHSGRPAF